MAAGFYDQVSRELQSITASGLYKSERVIATRQGARIRVQLSASYTKLQLKPVVAAFAAAGREAGVLA